jgi:hypothetical protein
MRYQELMGILSRREILAPAMGGNRALDDLCNGRAARAGGAYAHSTLMLTALSAAQEKR